MENNQIIIPNENQPIENLDKNVAASQNFKDKVDIEEQRLLTSPKNKEDNNNINQEDKFKFSKSDNEIFNINRKGNMIMLCFNKEGVPLIAIGPNISLAFSMMITIDIFAFCYFYFLWNILFRFYAYIGIIIFFIQTISYLITILINPGIPPKELWLENYKHLDEIGTYRICNVCKIIMRNEDKTDHCDECNVCIIGADHHCPWTSKCVGANNKNMFYIFVFSTFTLLIYFICGAFLTIVFIDDDKK